MENWVRNGKRKDRGIADGFLCSTDGDVVLRAAVEEKRRRADEHKKPKVKLSNSMAVCGAEAIQNPTRLEMKITSDVADRQQAHNDRNMARKLTPAERREKKERKLFDNPSNHPETVVCVYKINHLSLPAPQAQSKLSNNARENKLTGRAVISEGVSVVVVEGCPKAVNRFDNLMLRRIHWAQDAPVNKCLLVWRGYVAKPSFSGFSIQQCRTKAAARKIFSDAGVASYWELAVNFTEDQL